MSQILTSKPEFHLTNLAAAFACLRIGIRLGARTSILGGFFSTLGVTWGIVAVAYTVWWLVELPIYRERSKHDAAESPAGPMDSHGPLR